MPTILQSRFIVHLKILISKIFLLLLPFSLQASWVDDQLRSMPLRDKVAQLFVIDIKNNSPETAKLLAQENIGGVLFGHNTIAKQCKHLNRLQAISKTPLLVIQDAEWGLSMRLNDAPYFPKNMSLGAIQDLDLLRAYGYEIGKQARLMGIHMLLGPVVDVNTNPFNPIIGMRSFSDNPARVITCAQAFLEGLHASGMQGCLKHFPGHGDADRDSHKNIPSIDISRGIIPFTYLAQGGVAAIMTAHVLTPFLEENNAALATMSQAVVTGLLRNTIGFRGLVISDALKMGAVKQLYSPEAAALKAFQAGCDILLAPDNINACITALVAAVAQGLVAETSIDERVLRILKCKELCGLEHRPIIDIAAAKAFIQRPAQAQLRTTLYEAAMTVLHNGQQVIPLKQGAPFEIIDIQAINTTSSADTQLRLAPNATKEEIDTALALLTADTVIIRIHCMHQRHSFLTPVRTLPAGIDILLNKLSMLQKKIILVVATSPYTLPLLPALPTIVAYEAAPEALDAAMAVVRGSKLATGVLTISFNASCTSATTDNQSPGFGC